MFKIVGSHVSPAIGIPSPLLWGKPEVVAERLGNEMAEVRCTEQTITFNFPLSPAATVEYFRTYYGPTLRAFGSLGADAQEALRSDLAQLWLQYNRSGNGVTQVASTYLEVVAVRK